IESNSQVDQPKELTVHQGEVAEINCNHSITTYDRMFWYKQKFSTGPENIISGYKSAEDIGPFRMTFIKDKLATSLIITDVQISHAGTYYCAVNDTVMKGTKTHVVKPLFVSQHSLEWEQVSHPL
ncbi:hypothetical protein XELAEV_18007230mg, partial [Xenopus laevis]